MTKDYQQLLTDLYNGKISKLEIERDEIMDFQPIYMSFQFRKGIVGTAKRGGGATYRRYQDKPKA